MFNRSALLQIDSLNLYYYARQKRFHIVSDMSISIRPYEVFGLVGESGCGKTMTALSILRLLPRGIYPEGKIIFYPPDGNTIDILNVAPKTLNQIRGKHIGMIFQEPMTSLNPVFTVGTQIAETLIFHEGMSKKEAFRRAVQLLERVKIPEPDKTIRYYPHQLSGGMRQRVMIAIAISCTPSLLIADEPTTALDVTIQAEILDLLMEIKKDSGMSVILITHDLAVISETANRVAIMYAGSIVELAPVDRIFSRPSHPYTIGLLESLPLKKGKKLTPIPGVVPSPEELPRGCKFSNRCRFRIAECESNEPPLREISPEHFVRCIRQI
jgi:oligopeptide/dipeptide ABC transporter ATP-binding protein